MPDYYKCEIKTTTKAKPKPKLELAKTTMMFYFVCIIFFFIFGFVLFYIINKQPTGTAGNDKNYTILIMTSTVIAIISALMILIFQYIVPLSKK